MGDSFGLTGIALLGAGVRAAAWHAAAWLLTYALHSTILLGAVWLLTKALVRADAARDLLWKAGLVGGIVTASLQVGLGVEPLTGRIPLAHRAPPRAERREALVTVRRTDRGVVTRTRVVGQLVRSNDALAFPHRRGAHPVRVLVVRPGDRWPALLCAAWLAVAAALLARLARSNRRLRAQLARRESPLCQPLAWTLARLCAAAGVRRAVHLTCSATLASPAALGRGEICVPERAVAELDAEQQESMLAHELAHLVRGDAWWLAAAAVLERIFFFQPLNRLARREMRDLAEYLCDDWAVARTGRPIPLARCLHTVATWLAAAPTVQPVTAMLHAARSPLVRRTERLFASSGSAARSPRWSAAAAAASLAALAWLAPGVAPVAFPGGVPRMDVARVFILADSLARPPLVPWPDGATPLFDLPTEIAPRPRAGRRDARLVLVRTWRDSSRVMTQDYVVRRR